MSKNNEIAALEILKARYTDHGAIYDNFVKSESPDWHNEIDNIGLEVTEAISQEDGEFDNTLGKEYHKGASLNELKSMDKKRKFDNRFIEHPEYGGNYGLFYFGDSDIVEAVRKKLEKLNKEHFKRFELNWLFIYNKYEIPEENYLIAQLKKLQVKYNNGYSVYFIYECFAHDEGNRLYAIQASDWSWRKICSM